MFNFKALYEFIFKSFVVARDIEMIERLKKDGYSTILLIKRSWLYGLASSLWLIPLFILGGVNAFLIIRHFGSGNEFGIVLASIVGINILWTVYSSFSYLREYRDSYSRSNKILHTDDLLAQLQGADKSFIRCFNQLQFNFVLFLGVIIVYVIHIFFIATTFDIVFAGLDLVCIGFQLMLLKRFEHLLIDLEMDFNIAVKGKIFFINQEGMYSKINTLEGEKIKNIRSSYPNFLASFFHYGTLEVLTEGDETLMGHNVMEYVGEPERTVENMNSLISGNARIEERVHGAYLTNILEQFPNLDPKERKIAIAQYLRDYDAQIKRDYQATADAELRGEIEGIYRDYYAK